VTLAIARRTQVLWREQTRINVFTHSKVMNCGSLNSSCLYPRCSIHMPGLARSCARSFLTGWEEVVPVAGEGLLISTSPLCAYSEIPLVADSFDLDRSLALAGFLEQIGPLQFTRVVCLPVHGDTVQSVLESLAGAGVDHARLREISVVTPTWICYHTLTPVASWLM
jgi:hypothetical protein